MSCDLSLELKQYFAANPMGPLFEVGPVERDRDHPLNEPMRRAFESISEEVLAAVRDKKHFQSHHARVPPLEQDWFARELVVIRELGIWICKARAHSLMAQEESTRPAPYEQEAVRDVELCGDCLVPLADFEILDGVLVRNDHAFTILPPKSSPNSSYWLTRALSEASIKSRARVRLDPFLHGPASTFPRMSYKMLWYGPPLRWEDVSTIDQESFGRWSPASLSSGGQFTDFVMSPRGDEVHLTLEEVPESDSECPASSRYFHAIFSRNRDAVLHLDGAIRIFEPEQLVERSRQHVRDAGKAGTRIKVFRIDGTLKSGPVSSLGGTFFVWNYDVSHFFGAEIPSALLGDVI